MSMWVESLEPRQLFSAVPHLAGSTSRLLFNQAQGRTSVVQWVKLTNTGRARLNIRSISIAGADANRFAVSVRRTPRTLAPGASTSIPVSFRPSNASVFSATLIVSSNDPIASPLTVALRGVGTTGLYGDNEPSLQRILDAYQIPVRVGDANPFTRTIDGLGPSDEVPMQLLQKAGPGPVRMSLLAVFSWDSDPVARFGWYLPQARPQLHEQFVTPYHNAQTINPAVVGNVKFDPGAASFGFYQSWTSETHAPAYSQDALNTWDHGYELQKGHKVRFYPYRTASGRTVPNTYIMAMEQGFDDDFNDGVLVISNVAPIRAPARRARAAAAKR
jgi:hypothetical protein